MDAFAKVVICHFERSFWGFHADHMSGGEAKLAPPFTTLCAEY